MLHFCILYSDVTKIIEAYIYSRSSKILSSIAEQVSSCWTRKTILKLRRYVHVLYLEPLIDDVDTCSVIFRSTD